MPQVSRCAARCAVRAGSSRATGQLGAVSKTAARPTISNSPGSLDRKTRSDSLSALGARAYLCKHQSKNREAA
jgi:hypothetical protein